VYSISSNGQVGPVDVRRGASTLCHAIPGSKKDDDGKGGPLGGKGGAAEQASASARYGEKNRQEQGKQVWFVFASFFFLSFFLLLFFSFFLSFFFLLGPSKRAILLFLQVEAT
jgi:hypothetical protein